MMKRFLGMASLGALYLISPNYLRAQTSLSDPLSQAGSDFKPPIHYWKFDTVNAENESPDEGTLTHESSAKLNQVTLVPGKFGKAAEFAVNGTVTFKLNDQYLKFPGNTGEVVTIPYDMSELADKGYTVSLWFRGQKPTQGYQSLFNSGRRDGLEIRLNSMSEILVNTGQNWNFIKAPKAIPSDPAQWTQVAVAYVNGKVSLYVNGALIESQDGVPPPLFEPEITMGGVYEGNANQATVFTSGFVGDMDEVMIFDYALTADQVKKLSSGKLSFKTDAEAGTL